MTTTIDLNLVHVFTKVVESGSFTAAALALGLPKSSVSRAVGRLEDALGVRLLQRTTRKLGLTQAGEHYLAEVRGPMAMISKANSNTTELGHEPRGRVRLTMPPEIGEGLIADALVRFVQQHPLIELDLAVTNRRVNLVEEGFDLALRAGKLEDSSLVARKIATTDIALYAAPSYLERRGRPRRLADLTKHDCVIHRTNQAPGPWRLTGPRGLEEVSVSGPIVVDDLDTTRRLAIAALGIALMPDLVGGPEVARGRLVRVLPTYALRGTGMFIVSPPLRHTPAAVRALRDHLIKVFETQCMRLCAGKAPERILVTT